MARKRDYKAEYARRKLRAQSRGYRSPREEGRARKALGLPRSFRSVPRNDLPPTVVERITGAYMKRLRQESKDWSAGHSHTARSRFNNRWTNRQVEAYHRAYVERVTEGSRRGKSKEKSRRISEYVHDWTDIGEKEWTQEYPKVS